MSILFLRFFVETTEIGGTVLGLSSRRMFAFVVERRRVSRQLSECARVPASLSGAALDASTPPTQKSSGTLIRSILNEYTDFTKPDRALVSNQEAEHQKIVIGYRHYAVFHRVLMHVVQSRKP